MTEKTEAIRLFILRHAEGDGPRLGQLVADQFAISRQAASQHIRACSAAGLLEPVGNTRGRTYILKPLAEDRFSARPGDIDEAQAWALHAAPLLASAYKGRDIEAAEHICSYAFSEMFNNAVEHSGCKQIDVLLRPYWTRIEFLVADDGIGVFQKLVNGFSLEDYHHAALELTKGKLTTQRSQHSGEGIFFTSRACDRFMLMANGLTLSVHSADSWLLEDDKPEPGTTVRCTISVPPIRPLREVFNRYASDTDFRFAKTHVPVALAKFGDEFLVSRSRAKRVLARFERFDEVLLDFTGVRTIGQAFADEIFRVFSRSHAQVKILPINTTDEIDEMISRARAGLAEDLRADGGS